MLWKCVTQYANKFGKLSNGHRTRKVSFHFNPKKGSAKESSNYHIIALISCYQSNAQNSPSQASTVREPRTSRCYSWILKRQRNQKSNWQHPWDHKKAREYQKNTYFCFIDYAKALTVWITLNCGKFWKRWQYQTTWPASWETYMKVREQQLELDMEQQTGSK